MNLHIHIWTNLEYFDLLNKWMLLSTGKTDREIANFFVKSFPGELAETISPQYEINFMAIREIKKRLWQDFLNKINGIYYWSDNCEYLVPTVEELKTAMEKFREFNKNFPPHTVRSFTFVTPYVWDKMLERLDECLNYLNDLKIKNPVEVVVNDFGTLNLISKKYPNLKIVFGRLVHKLLKTPLVDTYWYEVHPAWDLIKNQSSQDIEKMKAEIIKWQMKFYASSELSLPVYQNFLKKYDVSQVAIDFMEKREDLFKNNYNDFWVDLYYPWSLVFTGRLCDTSAIENPERWYYATDDICPRTCNRYDIFYKVKTVWYKLIQRWNAGYKSQLNLDYLTDEFIQNKNNRFVFAPYIAV